MRCQYVKQIKRKWFLHFKAVPTSCPQPPREKFKNCGKKFEKSGMQTCLGQSRHIVGGMETKWRAHCGGRKHRAGTGRLPGGREGKDARDKEGAEHRRTSSQIHLGGCGRTAQSQTAGGQRRRLLVLIKDNDRPYKVFSSFRHFSYTV